MTFQSVLLASVFAAFATAASAADRTTQHVSCNPRGYDPARGTAMIWGELSLRSTGSEKLYRAAGNLNVTLIARSGSTIFQGEVPMGGIYNAEDRRDIENAQLSLNGQPGKLDMDLRFLSWFKPSTVRVKTKDGQILEFNTSCI